MAYLNPLELLEKEKNKYERAKGHAEKSFSEGTISIELFMQYVNNDTKIIAEYTEAINKLKSK